MSSTLLGRHAKHVSSLMSTARAVGLSRADACRVVVSEYGPNIGINRSFDLSFSGSKLRIRPNSIDQRIALEVFCGVYDECRLLASHPVTRIVDLGANIGASALYFNKRFPNAQIACVEPSPGNLEILKWNRKANALPIVIFDCAIGSKAGNAIFYDTDDPSCCSLMPTSSSSKQLLIRTVTIPEIMTRLGWDSIDLLKIDIEGYEKILFKDDSSWLSKVSTIVGEIHEGYEPDHLKMDLAPYGFQVTASVPNGYGQSIFTAVK